MIPLFLPRTIPSPSGALVGEALLPHYSFEGHRVVPQEKCTAQGHLYQMSEGDWRVCEEYFGEKRVSVTLLFWGEKTPGEAYAW